MPFDPLTLIMLAVLAVLIIFMFRNSRKRQRETADLAKKVVEGADVMTNFGVFGTILQIDEEANQVLLETTPGTVLKVHRQTVTRVITVDDEQPVDTDDHANDDSTEPEFGERVHDGKTDSDTDESAQTSTRSTDPDTDPKSSK